jgi:Protein of unknown function (DUF669)
MSDLGENFNTQDYGDRQEYQLIPAGEYPMMVVHSEMKDTKDMMGKFLYTELAIVGGQYDGRKVFERFNLFNQNAQAQQIGREAFADLVKACGFQNVGNSEQLHNIMVIGVVGIQQPKAGSAYGPSNTIKKYHPAGTTNQAPPQYSNNAPQNNNQAPQQYQQQPQQNSPANGQPASNGQQPANNTTGQSAAPPWRK